MIKFSSTLSAEKLKPVITATRPLWNRAMEVLVCIFLAAIAYGIGAAFWLLARTIFGLADPIGGFEPTLVREAVQTLLQKGFFTWQVAFIVLIGVPLFCYLIFLVIRTALSVFDDRYLAQQMLKQIIRQKGARFTYLINEESITVKNEKSIDEHFKIADLKNLIWLHDTTILKFKNSQQYLPLFLEELPDEGARERLKSMLTKMD